MSKRAQSSVEYLAIVGIALMLLIPATILFTNFARNTGDEVLSNQLGLIGYTLIDKSEEMYVLGAGSWVTIDITVPDSVTESFIANNNELVLRYESTAGISDAVFYSPRFDLTDGSVLGCPVRCNIGLVAGFNQIRIELNGSAVKLQKVT